MTDRASKALYSANQQQQTIIRHHLGNPCSNSHMSSLTESLSFLRVRELHQLGKRGLAFCGSVLGQLEITVEILESCICTESGNVPLVHYALMTDEAGIK